MLNRRNALSILATAGIGTTVFQRAHGLTDRPPLDCFLEQKDEILAGEEFPDDNKYYTE